MTRLPEEIEAPSRQRAAIPDSSLKHLLLELGNWNAMRDDVVFFGVGFVFGHLETRSEEDVKALAREAERDPVESEVDHLLGDKAGFFFEFAARQLFGVIDGTLPCALGQLKGALLDGGSGIARRARCGRPGWEE